MKRQGTIYVRGLSLSYTFEKIDDEQEYTLTVFENVTETIKKQVMQDVRKLMPVKQNRPVRLDEETDKEYSVRYSEFLALEKSGKANEFEGDVEEFEQDEMVHLQVPSFENRTEITKNQRRVFKGIYADLGPMMLNKWVSSYALDKIVKND